MTTTEPKPKPMNTTETTTTHKCPLCGRDGRLYITEHNPARVIIGCADCDMAENEDGEWVFFVGGITVK